MQPEYYEKMRLFPLGTSYIARRPAWAAMWMSVLLPGLGHLYVGVNFRGFMLMFWEMLLNFKSHLNEAIFFTIGGDFEMARQVLRVEWAVIYPFIYLFAIFDAYRVAVEYNKRCDLEELQPVRHFERHRHMPYVGLMALDRRNPILAGFLSFAVGGLGHLYNLQFLKAILLTAWHLGITVASGVHLAAVYTLLGEFDLARSVINYQWFLFWPSLMIFNGANAYTDAVEINILAQMEWQHRLRRFIRNPPWPYSVWREHGGTPPELGPGPGTG